MGTLYDRKGEIVMKELKKLIDVKSIVTLVLTILFCVLSLKQIIDGQSVMTIYTTVIAFYFGTQYQKKAGVVNGDTKETNTSEQNDSE